MSDELRLLADSMLGRLAKWLRLLGYDAAYDHAATDPQLARRARAEARILLTRDRELSGRRGLRILLVESQVLEEQVRQVREALGPPPFPALSRCAVCNAALEPVSHAEIAGRVPQYVLRTHSAFRYCAGCKRIYWPGSHVSAIRDRIEAFDSEDLGDD